MTHRAGADEVQRLQQKIRRTRRETRLLWGDAAALFLFNCFVSYPLIYLTGHRVMADGNIRPRPGRTCRYGCCPPRKEP